MKLKSLIALWSAIAIAGSFFLGYTPFFICVWYALVNVLTYGVYAKDNSAAKSKKWRTPENTLHLLALCGGWMIAVVAQETLRHKTQKTSFLVVFWFSAVLNISLFAALHVQPLDRWLEQTTNKAHQSLSKPSRAVDGLSRLAVLFRYRS